jgi:hypothetical protein
VALLVGLRLRARSRARWPRIASLIRLIASLIRWVCACALEGEMASDEADRLRAALTSELELNAKLQERLTNLELAPSSADEPRTKDGRLNLGRAPSRAPGAPTEAAAPETALAPETARGGGLVFKSESEWQSREREMREMRRQLAVARAHIEQLEKVALMVA